MKKRNRYAYVPICTNKRSINKANKNSAPLNPSLIEHMFSNKTSNYALRDGRVHCQSSEKTAVFIDRYGNRICLKENQSSFNTDKNGPGLHYTHGRRRLKKDSY